jgi:hypothetical protein
MTLDLSGDTFSTNMNWATHPTLYQFTHWWHWLTYGKNSDALQAVGTVIAALAATAAGIYAACAYNATLAQLNIAREQLSLSHAQFETERARFEEEQRRVKRTARTLFERMSAEEDSARPRFKQTGGYMPNGGLQNWEFRNYGTSAATDVTVSSSNGSEELARETIVGAGSFIRFRTTPQTFEQGGILFRFKTEFGTKWQIIVRLDGTEEVRDVIRNYMPEE